MFTKEDLDMLESFAAADLQEQAAEEEPEPPSYMASVGFHATFSENEVDWGGGRQWTGSSFCK